MNIVNNYATTIVTIFQSVTKDYEGALDTIKQTDQEISDILHEIEFTKAKNMYAGYLLYKELRELRLKRREAKEQVEILKEFYDYAKSTQGQAAKNSIQRIQGNAVKIRSKQEARVYTPRRREDLTIDGHSEETKEPFETMLAKFNQNKAYMKSGKMRK